MQREGLGGWWRGIFVLDKWGLGMLLLRVGLGVSVSIGDNVGSSRQKRGGGADFVGKWALIGVGLVGDRGEGEGERESILSESTPFRYLTQ